jgi:hypothetical protein
MYNSEFTDNVREGIVLRFHAPYRHSVAIFDSKLGRINAIFSSPSVFKSLVHGGLISYKVEPWRESYRMLDIELIQLPQDWVVQDLFFLHHLLEMALSFIPEHSRCLELFNLCMTLYKPIPEFAQTNGGMGLLGKKLFLARFFALLGIYPDDAFSKERSFLFKFLSGDEADITDLKETEELHKKLQSWLIDCIHTHPHANTFNTIEFVRSPS